MNAKSIYLSSFAVLILLSCNNRKKKSEGISTQEMEIIADNSMNSLDWEGTYEGLLPCGDCEGIKTSIRINRDKTYVARETYKGRSDSIFESKGTFKWDVKGQKITLSDSKKHPYLVGENILIHLNKDGNRVSGEMAEKYILKKIDEQLVGPKWYLVSINGENSQLKESNTEHPFIELSPDFTVKGYTGCNNLRGRYSLGEAQKISFSQLISTRKFCPEMETEKEFLRVMGQATYYAFEDHTFVLYNESQKSLASFKVTN